MGLTSHVLSSPGLGTWDPLEPLFVAKHWHTRLQFLEYFLYFVRKQHTGSFWGCLFPYTHRAPFPIEDIKKSD